MVFSKVADSEREKRRNKAISQNLKNSICRAARFGIKPLGHVVRVAACADVFCVRGPKRFIHVSYCSYSNIIFACAATDYCCSPLWRLNKLHQNRHVDANYMTGSV
jgi:hypothetical protein